MFPAGRSSCARFVSGFPVLYSWLFAAIVTIFSVPAADIWSDRWAGREWRNENRLRYNTAICSAVWRTQGNVDGLATGLTHAQPPKLRDVALYRGV
eukprot:COSAG05_NODE_4_length_49189_cov_157.128784_4_plen_96_part_00